MEFAYPMNNCVLVIVFLIVGRKTVIHWKQNTTLYFILSGRPFFFGRIPLNWSTFRMKLPFFVDLYCLHIVQTLLFLLFKIVS